MPHNLKRRGRRKLALLGGKRREPRHMLDGLELVGLAEHRAEERKVRPRIHIAFEYPRCERAVLGSAQVVERLVGELLDDPLLEEKARVALLGRRAESRHDQLDERPTNERLERRHGRLGIKRAVLGRRRLRRWASPRAPAAV